MATRTKSRALRIPFIYSISARTMFFMLVAILLFIFGSYFYLVNKTIMNIVTREKAQKSIAALSGTIGELEFKYIGLKNSVTLDLAHSKGFQDASPTQFLARNHAGKAITYNYAR